MGWDIEVVSEEGQEDYEVWTCKTCGYSVCLLGTGSDVCCCPECEARAIAAEVAQEAADTKQKQNGGRQK